MGLVRRFCGKCGLAGGDGFLPRQPTLICPAPPGSRKRPGSSTFLQMALEEVRSWPKPARKDSPDFSRTAGLSPIHFRHHAQFRPWTRREGGGSHSDPDPTGASGRRGSPQGPGEYPCLRRLMELEEMLLPLRVLAARNGDLDEVAFADPWLIEELRDRPQRCQGQGCRFWGGELGTWPGPQNW